MKKILSLIVLILAATGTLMAAETTTATVSPSNFVMPPIVTLLLQIGIFGVIGKHVLSLKISGGKTAGELIDVICPDAAHQTKFVQGLCLVGFAIYDLYSGQFSGKDTYQIAATVMAQGFGTSFFSSSVYHDFIIPIINKTLGWNVPPEAPQNK